MKRKSFLFAALIFTALTLGGISCDNSKDLTDDTYQRFNVEVIASDYAMGTVAGGGSYLSGEEIVITANANDGYAFQKWHDGNTENPRYVIVNGDATYTAIFEDIDISNAYVDLGLSVKWATRNVGANAPQESGNYYAWGEVKSKVDYSSETYKYGSEKWVTKYSTKSSWGGVDNKTILEKKDDAATYNLGDDWRMPTAAEWKELAEKCDWYWAKRDGVYGVYVNSKINNKYIFLPAAGYREGTELKDARSTGYYWTSSLCEDFPVRARSFRFNQIVKDPSYESYRIIGLPVRPVHQ